jgi:hypothetical protein
MFVGKTLGKHPHGRQMRREDDIKVSLRETGYKDRR